MRRAALAAAGALALAAVLAGCPLPQPLPDYPAGSITPPRIVTDPLFLSSTFAGSAATVLVPAGCDPEPVYTLVASIVDTNTIEKIEARWFVNYDASDDLLRAPRPESDEVGPNADTTNLTRVAPQLPFRPYRFPPMRGTPGTKTQPNTEANVLRVVELVVSNGFDTSTPQTSLTLPYRTPRPGFETQVHRWVFMTVAPSTAVPCPTP